MNQEQVVANDLSEQELFSKVFGWMALALGITAVVSMLTIKSGLVRPIVTNPFIFFGLMIGELIMVVILSGKIQKLSLSAAQLIFFAYAALNGLTFSAIFLAYTSTSIVSTFAIAAGIFSFMAVYGYQTEQDLTSFGSYALMGIVGLIIASIVNIFLHSSMLYWIITYGGVILFTGLTAYDTQKIKNLAQSSRASDKIAVLGALSLYLDFINLFIYLLRIFGKKK
ncbi:Bax inhibitor-1/YccA family protein [Halanaerobacter jeridensis]|uniref:FtsH-binding integral membrane protein n=1 Tax=Halanaerobacter jeridensis TaxID=706427 RepID=A0A939BQJ0_9FIRM|nr:Bax inhibitor-1/YccA family protein [Halanaerobacter jeridensis]MBM7556374.1 FtsH-binding integral membrane protein [Halanaerobacter jeridensis]